MNRLEKYKQNHKLRQEICELIRRAGAFVSVATNPSPMTHTDHECLEAIDKLERLYAEDIRLARERVYLRHEEPAGTA